MAGKIQHAVARRRSRLHLATAAIAAALLVFAGITPQRAPSSDSRERVAPAALSPPASTPPGNDQSLARALAAGDRLALGRELRARLQGGLAAALASLDQMPGGDGQRTSDLCCQLVAVFAHSTPAHAREALLAAYSGTLPPAIVDTLYGVLVSLRAPEEMAALIAALPPGDEQKGAARQLLAPWARADPLVALAWSRSHRNALDDAAIGALVEAAAHTEPRAALEFLMAQAGTFEIAMRWEMQLSETLAKNVTPATTLELLLWASAQPLEPATWNNLVRQSIARVVDTEPATALGFALRLEDPHLRDELLATCARGRWVHAYGAAHGATALAALFDDALHQRIAVSEYVSASAARAPDAVAALLATLPVGPMKNAAIHAAVPAMVHASPAAVATVLHQLSGAPGPRRESIAEILATLGRAAPTRATEIRDRLGQE